MTNEQKRDALLSRFTKEDIELAKASADEFDNTCKQAFAALPLPAEIEQTINEEIERMRAEIIKKNGEAPTLVLPIYRQLMRMGAIIALVADVKDWDFEVK